jgi:bifunctional non-homologous end joining protein LigD
VIFTPIVPTTIPARYPRPLTSADSWEQGERHRAIDPRAIISSVSAASLPLIAPAIPTLVGPFHRPGWVYEEKVDGRRIIAYKRGAEVQLISRTGRDHAQRFSEVARAIAKLGPGTLILDGEVAVFDEHLISRFHLLNATDPDGGITRPLFMAFDCLYQHGRDLRPKPLSERRQILGRAIAGADLVLPCRRLPADGAEAWAEVQRRGLEGLVAKDEAAPYRGGPSRAWLKVKVGHEGRFLIGGVGLAEGVRGLLVGELIAGELVYRGTVELGVSGAMLREQAGSPLTRATSPFIDLVRRRGVTWLEPRVTVEVQYNLTGGRLQAAVLRRISRGGP